MGGNVGLVDIAKKGISRPSTKPLTAVLYRLHIEFDVKGKTLWSNRSDSRHSSFHLCNGLGGRLPYKKGRDARWKFQIKPLKETNLGVAQAFFDA